MLGQICQYLRNWFDEDSRHNRLSYLEGTFTIEDGKIVGLSDLLIEGRYYRIIDSALNDGVYQFGVDTLKDETFDGTIQSMRVPPDVVALDAEIEAWITKNEGAINSPYQSESFGGYSYTKGYSGGTAQGVTWQSQFAARLAPWRKI